MGLLFGGATAIIGGIVYQLLVTWIPFIYINILLTLGFGALLGAITGLGLKRGQLRNNMIAALLCTVIGAGAVGFTHLAAYEKTLRSVASETGTSASELREKLTFQQFIELKAKLGWKIGKVSASGSNLSGGFVYFVWGVEALIIVGLSIGLGIGMVSDPYCEGCKEWTTEHKLPDRQGSSGSIKADAEAGKLDPIVQRKDQGSDLLAYTVHSCPKCKDSSYLTVDKVTLKEKKKGEMERSTEAIVSRAVLTTEQRGQLLDSPSGAAPPAAPTTT